MPVDRVTLSFFHCLFLEIAHQRLHRLCVVLLALESHGVVSNAILIYVSNINYCFLYNIPFIPKSRFAHSARVRLKLPLIAEQKQMHHFHVLKLTSK